MSDEQLNVLAKQRQSLQLQVENSLRSKKVADLKFYNRQRILYPNAEIFYEPETYSTLIQDETQSLNTSIERNRGLLEAELLTITSNKNVRINQIINALSDTQIEALVYFFTDFKNELARNTKSGAVTFDVFIAFTKKYLADRFSFLNNIKIEANQIPVPPNPINPLFSNDNNNGSSYGGFAETKSSNDNDDEDLPTNRSIGLMGSNNQNSFLPKTGGKQQIPITEQRENIRSSTKRTKPEPTTNEEVVNKLPTGGQTKKQKMDLKRKRENVVNNNKQDVPKKLLRNEPEPLKKPLLTFFKTNPTTIPRFFPFSTTFKAISPMIRQLNSKDTEKLFDGEVSSIYPETPLLIENGGMGIAKNGGRLNKPLSTVNEVFENTTMTDLEKLLYLAKFYSRIRGEILSNNAHAFFSYEQAFNMINNSQERNSNYATNRLKRIKDKYYKKDYPVGGAGNKNRIIFQGKGITDEVGHQKFYVDMKLLNNNILAVKYHSTRNYKMKPTPINDDIKSMVMDILLDKFSQKLFDLLKDNEKTLIIRFVQSMKLENIIPIKDDKLQEYFKQFLILKGEYLNGNDNPIVKRELRKYTLELMDMKKLPKHAGFALLHELSL